MLGHDLMAVCSAAGHTVTGFDLPELDVTDYPSMRSKLPEADWIINCAAYTRVDDAETERDAAFAINSEGVRNLARIGLRRLVPILHLSTDYVFDGKSKRPYEETDRVNPLNIYGASKLAGEKALRSSGGRS
jgi:dTDP-4-dehydrorhamnose reductase